MQDTFNMRDFSLDGAYFQDFQKVAGKFLAPVIVLLTVLSVGLSVVCLSLGFTTVFQHVFYLPIILVCVSFPKYGIQFASGVSLAYFALVVGLTQDLGLAFPALVRIAFFEIVAIALVALSLARIAAERKLVEQRDENDRILKEYEEAMAERAMLSTRHVRAFKREAEIYREFFYHSTVALAVINSELYIVAVNPAFEKLATRGQTDIVGRKISMYPFLENAFRANEKVPSPVTSIGSNGDEKKMQWVFTEVQLDRSSPTAITVAAGIELREWDNKDE